MSGIKLNAINIKSIFSHWDIEDFKYKETQSGCMLGDDEQVFHIFYDGSYSGHRYIYKAFLQSVIESMNSYCNNQNHVDRYYIEQLCNQTAVDHTHDSKGYKLWEQMDIVEQKESAIIYILEKMEK